MPVIMFCFVPLHSFVHSPLMKWIYPVMRNRRRKQKQPVYGFSSFYSLQNCDTLLLTVMNFESISPPLIVTSFHNVSKEKT